AYLAKWHQDNDPKIGQQVAMPETISFSGPDFDDVRPHLWTFFEAVRTRKRWWRTSCSVTMRLWPATWRMSRTFVRTLCLGTRPRKASKAEGRDRPSLT